RRRGRAICEPSVGHGQKMLVHVFRQIARVADGLALVADTVADSEEFAFIKSPALRQHADLLPDQAEAVCVADAPKASDHSFIRAIAADEAMLVDFPQLAAFRAPPRPALTECNLDRAMKATLGFRNV